MGVGDRRTISVNEKRLSIIDDLNNEIEKINMFWCGIYDINDPPFTEWQGVVLRTLSEVDEEFGIEIGSCEVSYYDRFSLLWCRLDSYKEDSTDPETRNEVLGLLASSMELLYDVKDRLRLSYHLHHLRPQFDAWLEQAGIPCDDETSTLTKLIRDLGDELDRPDINIDLIAVIGRKINEACIAILYEYLRQRFPEEELPPEPKSKIDVVCRHSPKPMVSYIRLLQSFGNCGSHNNPHWSSSEMDSSAIVVAAIRLIGFTVGLTKQATNA